jgi:hypothetical protein
MDVNVPICNFMSVEYIAAVNTVRFGTWGRGIWDFVVSSTSPPSQGIITSAQPGNTGEDPQLSLFPNPIRSGQFLNIDFPGHDQLSVNVYDLSGRLVLKDQLMINGGISTGELPRGTYICRISADGLKPLSRKFVVW